jgi:glycosyltransferase involved in cell wall biosynthesis
MGDRVSIPNALEVNVAQSEHHDPDYAEDITIARDPFFNLLDNKRLLLVIPAYNEERFIGSLVHKARRYTGSVLVIDDGSQDGTAQIASEAGAMVVRHNTNLGKGCALDTAFSLARQDPPDALILMDGDGQHMPEELAIVVKPILINGKDIVVGSRYLNQANTIPIDRVWGHWVINLLSNFLSGVHVTDSQSGYRAFSRKAIELISFHSSGFCVETEMQFIARDYDLIYEEVPIQILYLDPPKRSAVKQGFQVLQGILHLTGQYRPLLYFGLLGISLIFLGVLFTLEATWIFEREKSIPIVFVVGGVLTFVIGIISLFTGFMLHSIRGLLIDMLRKKNIRSIPFHKDPSSSRLS